MQLEINQTGWSIYKCVYAFSRSDLQMSNCTNIFFNTFYTMGWTGVQNVKGSDVGKVLSSSVHCMIHGFSE